MAQAMRIGYLIPEFPGQTHVWMWREITHLRQWGVPIQIFCPFAAGPATRARHDWADAAAAQTIYLWPANPLSLIASLGWAYLSRPLGALRAIGLAWRLMRQRAISIGEFLPVLVFAAHLARLARRQRIDHLHAHTCATGAVLCMLVKRLSGIPFSMTLNANIEWWGGAMRRKFEDAQFTIAITQWLLDQLIRDYPSLLPQQRLLGRVGVDTQLWKRAPAAPGNAAPANVPSPRNIITVGRLHPSKGHDVLLRAFEQIVKSGADVRLTIVGSGDHRETLEAQVRQAGLSHRVVFTGSLGERQIIALMNEAEVFVLASHAEPLGVVYMEAMAMEVATIGTRAGGVSEIITDGADGLLVAPNDPAALAGAIRRVLDDDDLRVRLGRAGRQRIEQAFDSRIGAATLYQRLFGHPPARPADDRAGSRNDAGAGGTPTAASAGDAQPPVRCTQASS